MAGFVHEGGRAKQDSIRVMQSLPARIVQLRDLQHRGSATSLRKPLRNGHGQFASMPPAPDQIGTTTEVIARSGLRLFPRS